MTDTISFPIDRMSEKALRALYQAEYQRWRAGLPLLHREALAAFWGEDIISMFEEEAAHREFWALTPAQRLARVEAGLAPDSLRIS